MGMLGGMMGGGGVMALGQKLMAAGVPMGQMQPLGQELFAFGREKVGEDAMGPIIGSIPGSTSSSDDTRVPKAADRLLGRASGQCHVCRRTVFGPRLDNRKKVVSPRKLSGTRPRDPRIRDAIRATAIGG